MTTEPNPPTLLLPSMMDTPLSMSLLLGEYVPPSILTLYNLLSSILHFGIDFTKAPQHDLPSLAPPKGGMTCSFSWTSSFFVHPPPPPPPPPPHLMFRLQCVKLCLVPASLRKATQSKTWAMYLQERPSTSQSNESS